MQEKIDKLKVKKGFGKSVATYRRNAFVQEAIASRLTNVLETFLGKQTGRILEIGCGPGVMTEKVIQHFQFEKYFANDIVDQYDEVIRSIHPKLEFLPGDVEKIDLPKPLDLVVSSSTFQWFQHLDSFLDKLHDSLQPGGILAFSSFGPENFREIRAVEGTGLNYLPFGKVERMLSQKFEILWGEKEILTHYFENPLSILKHMKLTGVNSLQEKPWTRSDMMRFEENYNDLFGMDLGVPLTYQPIYFIVRRI
ncbi:MAG: malonyl-ACP O-methyltransferase BioC [Marinifilaceae bacterium]